ncbi:MAG: hypothetical protein AB8F95_13555 [Bacteroidia bacterium]
MKFSSIISLLFLVILFTSCDKDQVNPRCKVQATLVSKSFSCLGYGIRTEKGEEFIAVSSSNDGHICPIAQMADSLEEGDEIFIEFSENGNSGAVCLLLPPPPFRDASNIWVTCLTVPDDE